MSTHILGISALYHDSAAALIRDGEIIAAAQEERFTRRKHDARFPHNAIAYCLREGRIHAGQVGAVAFYEKPLVKFDRLLETYITHAPRGFESFRRFMSLWSGCKLRVPEVMKAGIGEGFSGQLYCSTHHESHAASAFYPSPFREAAILTLDAVGEWSTSCMGTGHHNNLTLSHEMRFPHSLGMLYSAFTYYAGFKVNSGEYKLMGLAPYGVPKYVDVILDRIVHLYGDGSLWLDMTYFNYGHGLQMTSEKFHELFGGPPREPESLITQKEMDLAASIQCICEEVVLQAARHARSMTGMNNLVMAGGVALNCVANGRLRRESPFKSIWIQPAAGDAGAALGAALHLWHHQLGNPRHPSPSDRQKGSLLGPSFHDEEIKALLDSVGASYRYLPDEDGLLDRVVQLLDEEKVIGWFHGRMEYGPRALGSRSIIGDARSTRMQQVMNVKIKFRESFRPFAPCVLRELADAIFEMNPEEDSPYMMFVAPIRQQWRKVLDSDEQLRMKDPDLRVRVSVCRSEFPAITHVDYSARIQTVDAARHGRFYRLMRRFFEATGCPVVVNTSFNIRGEPIVCSPEDAYRCFMATAMDCLVLENFLLLKDLQPAGLAEDADAYKTRYALD